MIQYILIICLFFLGCGGSIRPWANGIIPYKYGSFFTKQERYLIEKAMKDWSSHTNIKFVEASQYYSPFYNYVYTYTIYKSKKVNRSTTGMCANAYMLLCNSNSYKVILHELGHCLGLRHEHQRPDRDKYIKVWIQNVKIKNKYCYRKLSDSNFLYPLDKFSYDYNSIMHYSKYTFSKNNKQTIEAPKDLRNYCISKKDILKIQYMYGKKIRK